MNSSETAKTSPLYLQLKADLLDRISEGKFQPGDRLPPEPVLAEQYGVSRMTANKAILELVAEGWLERSRRRGTFVAEASELSLRDLHPVLLTEGSVPTLENDYLQGIFWPLQHDLADHKVRLGVAKLDRPNLAVQLQEIDANPLVVVGPSLTMQNQLLEFARSRAPIVAIGTSRSGYAISTVDSDNLMGAALAVHHLVALQHKEIGFVGLFPDESNTIDRCRGFQIAMAANGLAVPEGNIIVARALLDRDHDARNALHDLLKSDNRPTAVFAAGAQLAMNVLSFAQSIGLTVPDDLSLVGYDDPPFVSRSFPALTTVRQPLAKMARTASRLILDGVGKASLAPEHHVFPPALVVRGSTTSPIAR